MYAPSQPVKNGNQSQTGGIIEEAEEVVGWVGRERLDAILDDGESMYEGDTKNKG